MNIFSNISPSSMPRVLPLKIVCGDCSGDDLLPVITNARQDGTCATCGGSSYELASEIVPMLAETLKQYRRMELDNEPKNKQTTTNRK